MTTPAMPARFDRAVSLLNGLMGDRLQERRHALSIAMELYHQGQPLACQAAAFAQAHPDRTGKLCVFVHGLAENESVWSFPGERSTTYGALLARDLAYTPLYVRYNTGLHLTENGERLARLLEEVVASYPGGVREIVLLGHSMGGLVARSACHVAARSALRWPRLTTHLFCLGSPHLGAPLEKLGHTVTWVLRAIRNTHTTRIADVLDLRSAGIKDLRLADLAAPRGTGLDPDALLGDGDIRVEVPPHIVQCAIAGTMNADERHFLSWMLGDGLVRVPSAAGRSQRPRSDAFRPDRIEIFGGVTHQRLAHDARVYQRILAWCTQAR
jgi:pimeloyl-ACP methyl ester carboxylesterase